ncbi:hypothetical protein NITHO_2960006 [Nitrolancea hollandica Lb]|uniref:Uncharacterized protein n=1 Tax=Nitrolancea hollandica Lb TaxID=1129897 RepID=I4EH22_9BACT|nr:hypothetical protein NITHO_2960006 [Nitrolancea hollandica Lb]
MQQVSLASRTLSAAEAAKRTQTWLAVPNRTPPEQFGAFVTHGCVGCSRSTPPIPAFLSLNSTVSIHANKSVLSKTGADRRCVETVCGTKHRPVNAEKGGAWHGEWPNLLKHGVLADRHADENENAQDSLAS